MRPSSRVYPGYTLRVFPKAETDTDKLHVNDAMPTGLPWLDRMDPGICGKRIRSNSASCSLAREG